MVMEILAFVGNLPRTGFVALFKALEKKFRKCMGIFINDAMVILLHGGTITHPPHGRTLYLKNSTL
jgi:hypothetical protein